MCHTRSSCMTTSTSLSKFASFLSAHMMKRVLIANGAHKFLYRPIIEEFYFATVQMMMRGTPRGVFLAVSVLDL